MGSSESLPDLVATAQANAKQAEDRIAGLRTVRDGQDTTETQVAQLSEAIGALEHCAVDIFSVFEARMQHHFRRGPFSRKLKVLLIESGQADLADRIHQYYLGINVLKHGKGASYRELLNAPSALFDVSPNQSNPSKDTDSDESLVDITKPGFFDGLTQTILEAYQFLEMRQPS